MAEIQNKENANNRFVDPIGFTITCLGRIGSGDILTIYQFEMKNKERKGKNSNLKFIANGSRNLPWSNRCNAIIIVYQIIYSIGNI